MLKNYIQLLQKLTINKNVYLFIDFMMGHELKLDFNGSLW